MRKLPRPECARPGCTNLVRSLRSKSCGHSCAAHMRWAGRGPEERTAIANKGRATLGPEGRVAATRKTMETLGPEGLRARALKRHETLGPEGRSAVAHKIAAAKDYDGRRAGVRARIERLDSDPVARILWKTRISHAGRRRYIAQGDEQLREIGM